LFEVSVPLPWTVPPSMVTFWASVFPCRVSVPPATTICDAPLGVFQVALFVTVVPERLIRPPGVFTESVP
jgi:hypothetical protein